jgi:transcriptional regulator of acetoin/glycerol metabolism
MHIRVLLLCSRENAHKVLDCLIGQPDITVECCQDVQKFLLKIAGSPYNLIITDDLKEFLAPSSGKESGLERRPEYIRHSAKPVEVPFPSTPFQDYPGAFKIARHQFEKEYLTSALAEHSANISQTAEAIGITRRNLQIKIKQLHIDIERLRRRPSGDASE